MGHDVHRMKNLHPILLLVPTLFSCAQHRMATADKAFDRMAYARAACAYEKVLEHADDREAALKAAVSYTRMNKPANAVDQYAYAERMAPLDAGQNVAYGQVLLRVGRNNEALRHFVAALELEPTNATARELALATGDPEAFYADTSRYIVEPMRLNGVINAFSAIPFKEGILFVGERELPNSKRNPWNDLPYLDILASVPIGDGQWSTPNPLKGEVNGRYHEGPMVHDRERNVIYFTRSDYYKFRLNKDENSTSHLVLFRAEELEDGTWGNIHLFMYNGDSFSSGHPALSTDGNTLYYISDMPGGEGGTDIYRCTRTEDGWTLPENLAFPINTPGNEMFPTMHGDTLYFASDGHRGMGGLDIFRSIPQGDGWGVPKNLNYPINTPHDDFSFLMLDNGLEGYLSSNRNGMDQVHRFEVQDPTITLTGTMAEFGTDELLENAEVRLLDITAGKDVSTMTGPDGTFTFPLETGSEYRITGSKEGMLNETREITTKGHRNGRRYHEDLKLHPIDPERAIVVENIYYDYDQWDIRDDAVPALNRLAELFKANPEVRFELSSHTDSRASRNYNLVLSEARARSAVDHLIRQGVDPDRIVAKGYGESKLVNHCHDGVECSEEEHQENRRTEFRIVGIGNMVYDDPSTKGAH